MGFANDLIALELNHGATDSAARPDTAPNTAGIVKQDVVSVLQRTVDL
jgi:hypothetical protein